VPETIKIKLSDSWEGVVFSIILKTAIEAKFRF
jgi:hypothetical protein